jgi:hypothetical protein
MMQDAKKNQMLQQHTESGVIGRVAIHHVPKGHQPVFRLGTKEF